MDFMLLFSDRMPERGNLSTLSLFGFLLFDFPSLMFSKKLELRFITLFHDQKKNKNYLGGL
jgi:hypothetical protein